METLAFAQYVGQFADVAIVVLVLLNIKQSRYLISHHIDIQVIKEHLKKCGFQSPGQPVEKL